MKISDLTLDEIITLLTASVCAMKSTRSMLDAEQEVTEENYQQAQNDYLKLKLRLRRRYSPPARKLPLP